MLTSSFALQSSINKLTVAIKDLKDAKETADIDKRTLWTAIIGFVLALLFFVIELYLLFYVLKYVFASSPPGPGRNVRVVLLIFFTLPFSLLAAIVDPRFSALVDKH